MRLITKRRGAAAILMALAAAAVLAALLSRASAPQSAAAASHREAPLISLDPEADITDFFMFRSYEPGQSDKVDLIMDVIPGEEPSSGPNYFNFDPSVLYAFNIDNDNDGRANDIRFELSFDNQLRGDTTALGLPLAYTAIPPITHLDGAGSEGLGVRQSYTLTMVKGKKRTVLGSGLFAVPSNVGPRTMPNYQQLVDEGTYTLDGGVRVFAGQRDDPFYIDLGAVFDTLNLRSPGTDMLSGFNVHTIALQVPSALLTGDTGTTTLGAYASTSRQKISVQGKGDDKGEWVQVQRLANPLVNEVIIGLQDKDRWNMTEPEDESKFLQYYLKPRLALAMQLVFGADTGCTPFGDATCSPNPPAPAADLALSNFNRTDLVNVLLKYQPSDTKLSELLRLNLNIGPTPLASQQRLTVLAGDNAGWPNGRRPIDDVTDVAVQVVGGPNYIGLGAGDSVDANDKALPASFPFIASPWDGRGRFHANP
jgi:Domain of unknown function (DUF4331)